MKIKGLCKSTRSCTLQAGPGRITSQGRHLRPAIKEHRSTVHEASRLAAELPAYPDLRLERRCEPEAAELQGTVRKSHRIRAHQPRTVPAAHGAAFRPRHR